MTLSRRNSSHLSQWAALVGVAADDGGHPPGQPPRAHHLQWVLLYDGIVRVAAPLDDGAAQVEVVRVVELQGGLKHLNLHPRHFTSCPTGELS